MPNQTKSLNINGISYELKDDIAREQLKGKLDVLSLAEAWTEGKSYKIGDSVSFNGAYYRCVKATNSFSPESDEYWTKLSLDMIATEKGMLVNEFEAKTAGSYEAGEIVSYEGVPYKRNSTAGDDTSWDATHWDIATNTDLATRFKGLKLDGNVTDEFVARCLGKQVAKEALSKGYAFFDLVPVTEGGFKVFAAKDHAINRFTLADATPVKVILPNATDSNGRDFILKVNVTSATMPTFEIVKPTDAASVGIEAEYDEWADLEAGINYFTITETDRA